MQPGISVLGFADYESPARALAVALDAPFHLVDVHHFPDGESRLRLPERLESVAVIVRTLDHPNAKLVELMLAAATARELGAAHIVLVAPYLCYMRQDRAFMPGEAVSQRIIGRWLADMVDAVVTVDPHLHRINSLGEAIPNIPAVALSATRLMGERLRSQWAEVARKPLLVGPDEESQQWVAEVAACAGTDFVVANKVRQGDRAVEIRLPEAGYAGREAVLVDDVIASGHTLMHCARLLYDAGCLRVSALCTHALLAGDAESGMREAGIATLESTDSLLHESNRLSVVPLLAESVRAVITAQSFIRIVPKTSNGQR